MNQRPTLREQIDACRADSDDLHLPEHAGELAELKAGVQASDEIRGQFDRAQRSDRVLRGAMQDVPLPAGLESRLLAAVQAAASQTDAQLQPLACVASAGDVDSRSAEATASPLPRVGIPRRRWLGITSGSLAFAAAILLAVFLGNKYFVQQNQPITKDQLTADVQEWLRLADSSQKWDATTNPALFPSQLLTGSPARSRTVSTSQGSITVFDVALRGSGNRALLLALPTQAKYPVNTLPVPAANVGVTGGWTVSVWQRGGVLYVLAVRGDARLEHFIRPQAIG